MQRLNALLLQQLPLTVVKPHYNRAQTKVGIVHLGVGAFHRAHQAWYTEQVLQAQGGDWAIAGASLRSADVREQLHDQSCLYSVVTRDSAALSVQVIGALKKILVAPENPQLLIDTMAAATVKVISLTITEKGYCHLPATGALDLQNSGISADLANYQTAPHTAIGYLVAALEKRKHTDAGGVTVMSCDNLPHNGRLLQGLVRTFAHEVAPALAVWIEKNVKFPCSMVDRIVPAPTAEDFSTLEALTGVRDAAAVFTEPFCQWVIERNFAGPVPEWERVGALYVDDVAPFEEMKLRLLNGSHSIIAYLGYLAGYDYVHEVIADQYFCALVRRFMQAQVEPTLAMPADFDLSGYMESLITRFSNKALNHKTRQIAQDGSQKIPQRWLRVLEALLLLNKDVSIIALAIAGWIRYLEGQRDNGEHYTIDDPLAESLASVINSAASDAEKVTGILAQTSVFADLLTRQPKFTQQVLVAYQQLVTKGVRDCVVDVACSS